MDLIKSLSRRIFICAYLVMFLLSLSVVHAAGMKSGEFLLGPGDLLKITVYDQPDLATTARVSVGGTIMFPLVGVVKVGGLSSGNVERLIARLLKEGGFVRNPQVGVAIEEIQSQQASILGEVRNPGKYVLQSDVTVVDLLAMAGGLTSEAADIVTLIRNVAGKDKVKRIGLTSFFDGNLEQNILVKGGDIFLIQKMNVFYIYGEVKRSGVYKLERNMTVVQALSVGGGLSNRGTQKGIRVKRRNKSGRVDDKKAGLNFSLMPNDVIYVKESLF